ncbi:MAG: lipocalin family protein [Candidatus Cryptobacteroides sp.]
MKTSRLFAAATVAAMAAVLASCTAGIRKDDLVGIWVQPVPGMAMVQGIELKADGSARAVNMATLQYDSWTLDGRNIILSGSSIGNGTSCSFSDTLGIVSISRDSLSLKKGSLILEYGRSVEECGFSANPGTIMKGTVTFGPEVHKFRPVGEDKEYWIIDKSGYFQTKYNESGEAVWSAEAKLEMKEIDASASEFGKDYDGTFQVLRVISISDNKQ